MKVIFMPAKSKFDINEVIKKVRVDGKVGLVASAQYIHKLEEAQKLIPNSIIAGQVLGCNALAAKKVENEVDSFLFIGSGPFHPIEIAVKTKKPTYMANPNTNEFSRVSEEEIKMYENKIKARTKKFYAAEKVGILVSTKPGQNNMKLALKLQEKLNKESYIFSFDTLNVDLFEDFPDIEIWINTACPRIDNKNIINIRDLPKL